MSNLSEKQKAKLKDLLKNLTKPEEKEELALLENNDVNLKINSFKLDLDKKINALAESLTKVEGDKTTLGAIVETHKLLEKTKKSVGSYTEKLNDAYETMVKSLIAKLDELKQVSINSSKLSQGTPPLYKDMINAISEVNKSIKEQPIPVWRWPQYAAVGVRNKSFSNIDPANAYQDASTTESAPYGILPVFDNAGVIARIKNTVGLPVNIVQVTTSNFAGIKVFQENTPASPTVGDGTTTVTTAGTRVQLAANACNRVRIQAHESNTGTIVVGSSTVVAALSGRRGIALFATQSEVFNINNTNLLWIDSTVNGDKITFCFEN